MSFWLHVRALTRLSGALTNNFRLWYEACRKLGEGWKRLHNEDAYFRHKLPLTLRTADSVDAILLLRLLRRERGIHYVKKKNFNSSSECRRTKVWAEINYYVVDYHVKTNFRLIFLQEREVKIDEEERTKTSRRNENSCSKKTDKVFSFFFFLP